MTDPAITTSETWQRLLAYPETPRQVDLPAPGYYRTKLRTGGPWVAVRIWMEHGDIHALAAGKHRDAWAIWPSVQAIRPEEYLALRDLNLNDPTYHPTNKVDLIKEITKP